MKGGKLEKKALRMELWRVSFCKESRGQELKGPEVE